ncbi:putative membrane domain protein [Burkholderia pseudomallei]|nr:putative membrane domain protein [Burkholderia pseudomallei]
MPQKQALAPRGSGRTRVSSSRSAAIVRIRNASHHATAANGSPVSSQTALPAHQHPTLAASTHRNSAACRRSTVALTASAMLAAPVSSAAARIAGAPASNERPAAAAVAGTRYAQRAPSATARSTPITAPKNTGIISTPCHASRDTACVGAGAPSRARPVAMPHASSATMTTPAVARTSGRASEAAGCLGAGMASSARCATEGGTMRERCVKRSASPSARARPRSSSSAPTGGPRRDRRRRAARRR